jgi:hypothetical protein
MLSRRNNLKAATIFLVVVAIAAGGVAQDACDGSLSFHAKSRGSSSNSCCAKCGCSKTVTEVRACCCSKRDKGPGTPPTTNSGKVRSELTWMPWAYCQVASVPAGSLEHTQQPVCGTSLVARSAQAVLCISEMA